MHCTVQTAFNRSNLSDLHKYKIYSTVLVLVVKL